MFEWNEDGTAFRVAGSPWVSIRRYLIGKPGGLYYWLLTGLRWGE